MQSSSLVPGNLSTQNCFDPTNRLFKLALLLTIIHFDEAYL